MGTLVCDRAGSANVELGSSSVRCSSIVYANVAVDAVCMLSVTDSSDLLLTLMHL